jgi:hypothetical protein
MIRVQTDAGPFGATLDFPDGLVVVWADNSMGKSTCVKSILVALGMEAMLSPSQADLPLPPAVKARLNSATGEHDVLESEVLLEIENAQNQRIVIQRTIKGERDKNLITVHEGPALTNPTASVRTRDMFVSRQGAATRELGFHHYLAKFLGWSLPTVQTYDGNEYPLYMQCIVPYFIVEQTRGWSTVQPPLPSHFRIRDAHKRSVEFLLNMDAHQIALTRQELVFEQSRIEAEWTNRVSRAADLGESAGGTIQALPQKPVATWPPAVPPTLAVPEGDSWINIGQRIAANVESLNQLILEEIPRVQEIATVAQSELTEAEHGIREKQTLHSRLLDALESEQQEVKRVDDRLAAIAEDIQQHKDVRVLKQLGSRQDSSIDQGTCPVCHQTIQDSLVPLEPEQSVMTLDENIQFLTEQLRTYEGVQLNARQVVESRSRQVRAVHEDLSSRRDRVRALRETLVSDGRLPSIAAIQTRMTTDNAIRKDREVEQQLQAILEGFDELSQRWKDVQERLSRLPNDDVTADDKQKLLAWTATLREQLTQYGFGSFPVNQVVISTDTYRPEHEGFDLQTSFSLQTSISASDLIRTIWSYLHGLLELSRSQPSNHPGCIIFDEPRQQSTRDLSFNELLRRTSMASQFGQQVIFFTSENIERLQSHLSGLPHQLLKIDGRVLKEM